jgi:hypothetical protein
MGTDLSTFTVKLDPALLARFKAVCAVERKSMSTVIREFCEWYTSEKEKRV